MSKMMMEQTEVEELREALRERDARLEAITKELERFSYSVSHDLRAPLRAIEGFSKILLDDYLEKLDEEGQRFLKIIDGSSRKMTSLLDDLLQFSRSGRHQINPARLNMNEIVANVWEELKPDPRVRKVNVEIKTLPEAWGDPTLIRQAWTQLLRNAIKFTASRQEATIKISGKANANQIVYGIEDNGVGFDMKSAQKLFGVFQRLHTDTEFAGNGIGLAITHQIIQRHSGKIWTEAKIDEGASFYFALPRAEQTD